MSSDSVEDKKKIQDFIRTKRFDEALTFSIYRGYLAVAKKVISLGAKNLGIGMKAAIATKSKEAITLMIEKGFTDFDYAVYLSYDDPDLVTYFLEKEHMFPICYQTNHTIINSAMEIAIKENRLDIARVLSRYGANDWNRFLLLAVGKDLDLVKFTIEKGAYNFVDALFHCARGNFVSSLKYLWSAWEDNWRASMDRAIRVRDFEQIRKCIPQRPHCNIKFELMMAASSACNIEIVEYLHSI